MGQRLNLEITRKGKPLANAYYHWSGYTASSLYLLEQVYSFIVSNRNIIKDKKLLAIRALESTGAGFEEYEGGDEAGHELQLLKASRKYYDLTFSKETSRNNGLLHCFPKGMKCVQDWAEGTTRIDIDTLLIDSDVFCYYSTKEEVKDYFDNYEDNLETFDFNTGCMDIGSYRDLCKHIIDTGYVAKVDDGYVSELG